MSTNNINDAGQIHYCTSCQMCGAVCPTKSINILLDNDGYYRPYINEETCISCGKCKRVCYKFDENIKMTEDISQYPLYGAYAKDEKILESTTSGGIADLLAKELIKNGFSCIGVVYDVNKNIAYNKIARTKEETDQFKGSKYIQSLTIDAFKQFVIECKNQKFAIFGLPCHIYAIDKFLNSCRQRNKHLLIDVFCHGCPSMLIWKNKVEEIKNKFKESKLHSVNFRSKIKGWGDFKVKIVIENNGVLRDVDASDTDDFYTLFFSDELLNDSCNDCQLRSTFEYTDIRLGDFWGHTYVGNHKGVSAVTLVSANALTLWNNIIHQIESEPQPYSKMLPYQSYDKSYKINYSLRKILLDSLRKDSDLKQTVNLWYKSLSFKRKIKYVLKKMINHLPNSIISKVKILYYKM